MAGAKHVERAIRGQVGVALILTPQVGGGGPVGVSATCLFEQACLQSDPVETELFPELGAFWIEHVEALLSFVAAGVGVSCSPSLVERVRFRGVKTVPLRPDIRGVISAVWRPLDLPATAARFLEELRAELELGAPPL